MKSRKIIFSLNQEFMVDLRLDWCFDNFIGASMHSQILICNGITKCKIIFVLFSRLE